MQLTNPFEQRRSRFRIPPKIKVPTLLSLLIASLTAFASLALYPSLQPIVPLFYSLALLEQQIVPKEFLFFIPALSLGFFFLNAFFSQILSRMDELMMQMVSWSTLLINILLLFAFFRIIMII